MIVETIDRDEPIPPLTQAEVAEFLARFRGREITRQAVAMTERRALRKLANNPEVAALLADVTFD